VRRHRRAGASIVAGAELPRSGRRGSPVSRVFSVAEWRAVKLATGVGVEGIAGDCATERRGAK
jgi:hypothetical protein